MTPRQIGFAVSSSSLSTMGANLTCLRGRRDWLRPQVCTHPLWQPLPSGATSLDGLASWLLTSCARCFPFSTLSSQPSAPLPAHRPSGLHCSVQEYGHRNWTLDRGCTRDGRRHSLQDTAGVGAILAKWLFPLMDP